MIKWGEATYLLLVGGRTRAFEPVEAQQGTEMEVIGEMDSLREEPHEKEPVALVSFRDFVEDD